MNNSENESDAGHHKITTADYPAESAGVSSSLRCHPGAVREENQDCVGRVEVPLGELFLVLDGVGGRTGGAQAAALSIQEYSRFLSRIPAQNDPLEALAQATQWVNRRLEDGRQSGPAEMQEMASTVALVLLHEGIFHVGHIGDSRVYRMRGGEFALLTTDHSVVQRMIAEGILSEDEAQSHPSSHILTRSLGQPDAALEVSSHHVQPADILLICSDGLWGYTPADRIEELLAKPSSDTASIADALLERALAGKAGDNISIVVVRAGDAWTARKEASGSIGKRFRRGQLYAVLAITILLASAALYMYLWGS